MLHAAVDALVPAKWVRTNPGEARCGPCPVLACLPDAATEQVAASNKQAACTLGLHWLSDWLLHTRAGKGPACNKGGIRNAYKPTIGIAGTCCAFQPGQASSRHILVTRGPNWGSYGMSKLGSMKHSVSRNARVVAHLSNQIHGGQPDFGRWGTAIEVLN